MYMALIIILVVIILFLIYYDCKCVQKKKEKYIEQFEWSDAAKFGGGVAALGALGGGLAAGRKSRKKRKKKKKREEIVRLKKTARNAQLARGWRTDGQFKISPGLNQCSENIQGKEKIIEINNEFIYPALDICIINHDKYSDVDGCYYNPETNQCLSKNIPNMLWNSQENTTNDIEQHIQMNLEAAYRAEQITISDIIKYLENDNPNASLEEVLLKVQNEDQYTHFKDNYTNTNDPNIINGRTIQQAERDGLWIEILEKFASLVTSRTPPEYTRKYKPLYDKARLMIIQNKYK